MARKNHFVRTSIAHKSEQTNTTSFVDKIDIRSEDQSNDVDRTILQDH